MTRFTHTKCVVLQDGKWLCEAVDEIGALMIVNALRALEEQSSRRVTAPINLNTCRVRQEGDEMVCACGLRWSVDDTAPPLCIHRAPR